ncbi:COP9 signalosome complex subunit 8 [Platanthera zijinensis]|uniref:COP9 signalosome complex subunit 8 n=1 Tax=Platanthera zijinensis TaxID=2320716 RepID=A0AAP0G2S5_9ASPA
MYTPTISTALDFYGSQFQVVLKRPGRGCGCLEDWAVSLEQGLCWGHASIRGFDWSLKPLALLLPLEVLLNISESYAKRNFQLLVAAYSTISVADTALFLGMSEDDATSYRSTFPQDDSSILGLVVSVSESEEHAQSLWLAFMGVSAGLQPE